MTTKIRPPTRGIQYESIYSGIMPVDLPGTAPACHAWAPFAQRINESPDPLGLMYEIADEHFAYREHGYQWVVALFASPLRASMINRVLGCGNRYGVRNRTRRGKEEATRGMSEEELAARPTGYIIPNAMRSMQFARRSRILPEHDLKEASVVDYLRALATGGEDGKSMLRRIQGACASLFTDAWFCPDYAADILHARLLITLTYLCAGRPDVISFGVLQDDVTSNVQHWNVMIRCGDSFFSLSGHISK